MPASSVRRLPEAGCLEMGEDKTEVSIEMGKNVVFLGFDCKPKLPWF